MKMLKRASHWLLSSELATLPTKTSRVSFALNRSHPILALAATPESGPLICPKCDSFMNRVIFRGIPVERCNSCLGIFFDDGEVEELAAKLAC